MDRPLLDSLRHYTILNHKSKHFFPALKIVLISALIGEDVCQYRYICNRPTIRPTSADNIGKPVYQFVVSRFTIMVMITTEF